MIGQRGSQERRSLAIRWLWLQNGSPVIASKWTPAGIGHPRGDRRRTGASFEQGGVGTSVFRAFLLLVPALPILRRWRANPNPGAMTTASSTRRWKNLSRPAIRFRSVTMIIQGVRHLLLSTTRERRLPHASPRHSRMTAYPVDKARSGGSALRAIDRGAQCWAGELALGVASVRGTPQPGKGCGGGSSSKEIFVGRAGGCDVASRMEPELSE